MASRQRRRSASPIVLVRPGGGRLSPVPEESTGYHQGSRACSQSLSARRPYILDEGDGLQTEDDEEIFVGQVSVMGICEPDMGEVCHSCEGQAPKLDPATTWVSVSKGKVQRLAGPRQEQVYNMPPDAQGMKGQQ